MLKFNVKNQIIERLDDFRVVADSRNYLTADFMLSDEWDNKRVFASFSHMDIDIAKEAEIKDGQCLVPWEVIKPPFFSVSLFCGDLITSNVVSVQVEASGLKDGEPAGTPTPTVWAQYLSEMEKVAQDIKNLKATATEGNTVSVSQTTTEEGIRLDFTLPRGEKGDKGDKGDTFTYEDLTEEQKRELLKLAFSSLIATYTAKELVSGITAEVGVKFIYDEEEIDTFSVVVEETTVIEKTPVTQKARIAAELLKAERTRFVFYSGGDVVYTAKVRSTLPNRGMLLIEKG